jgi:hypothetical protein
MAINLPIISEWNPKGLNKAINDFKKLETRGQKAAFAIKKAAVPAGLALAAMGAFAFDAVKAFAEDDDAAQKLATTLRNTTKATDAQVASVEDFITQTSRAAAVADDELRPALSSLVRGTKDVNQAQNLLNLALDISAGTGKDLGAVSDALSKAYNGNFTALKKLDPALAELIKSGASADEVFAALGKTFEGQASVAANTTQGSMKNLNIQMGELKESIGAAVMPALQALIPYLMKFATWAQENPDLVKIAGAAIVGLTASIVAMNIAMALNPIGAIVLALGLLATGIAIVYVKFEQFRPLLLGIFGPAGIAVGAVLYFKDTIIGAFNTIKNLGVSIFDGIGGAFKGVINAVISAMEKGLNFAIKGLNTILDGIDKAAGPWVNFGTIPDVKLPRLAEGGIVSSPTIAMIGEGREPEAVIPLSKMGQFGMGGNTITVNVNGGDPNSIVRALQQYVRQSGPVPVNTRAM